MINDFESAVDDVNFVQSTQLPKHRLEQEMKANEDVGKLNSHPMLSLNFVARTQELKELNTIVEKY